MAPSENPLTVLLKKASSRKKIKKKKKNKKKVAEKHKSISQVIAFESAEKVDPEDIQVMADRCEHFLDIGSKKPGGNVFGFFNLIYEAYDRRESLEKKKGEENFRYLSTRPAHRQVFFDGIEQLLSMKQDITTFKKYFSTWESVWDPPAKAVDFWTQGFANVTKKELESFKKSEQEVLWTSRLRNYISAAVTPFSNYHENYLVAFERLARQNDVSRLEEVVFGLSLAESSSEDQFEKGVIALGEVPFDERKHIRALRVKNKAKPNFDKQLCVAINGLNIPKKEYGEMFNFLGPFLNRQKSVEEVLPALQQALDRNPDSLFANEQRAKNLAMHHPSLINPYLVIVDEIDETKKKVGLDRDSLKRVSYHILLSQYSAKDNIALIQDQKKLEGLCRQEISLMNEFGHEMVAKRKGSKKNAIEGGQRIIQKYIESIGHKPTARDPEKRKVLIDGAETVEILSDQQDMLTRYFSFWKKIDFLPANILRSWVDSFGAVDFTYLNKKHRESKDSRLLRYIKITTECLRPYHENYGILLHEISKGGAKIFGAEKFLFQCVRDRELDEDAIKKRISIVEAMSRDSRKDLGLLMNSVKLKAPTGSNEYATYMGATRLLEDGLLKLIDSLGEDCEKKERAITALKSMAERSYYQTSELILDTTKSMIKLAERMDSRGFKENVNHLKEISLVDNKLAPYYLDAVSKVAEFVESSKEREYYSNLMVSLFIDNNSLTGKLKKDRWKAIEDRCVNAVRSMESLSVDVGITLREVLTRVRKGISFAARTEEGYPPMRLDDLIQTLPKALEINPEKTQEFCTTGIKHRLVSKRKRKNSVISLSNIVGEDIVLGTATPHRYLGILYSALPRLMPHIELNEWKQLLDITLKQDTITSSPKLRSRQEKSKYIEDLVGKLQEMKSRDIPFAIGELHRVMSKVYDQEVRSAYFSLDDIIISSCTNKRNFFSDTSLGRMHDILCSMHFESLNRYSQGINNYLTFVDLMENLPEQYRDEAIRHANVMAHHPKLLSGKADKNLEGRCEMLLAFSNGLNQNIASLEEGFGEWVELGVNRSNSFSELSAYFRDEHGYYAEQVVEISGGLPLAEVQTRLHTYSGTLTPRPVKLERIVGGGISCSFDGEAILLPAAVNIFEDNKKNYQLYKALASYQAGAIALGTYSFDPEDFSEEVARRFGEEKSVGYYFSSFENPGIAQSLFSLAEFTRIDTRLSEQYEGLRKDLELFKAQQKETYDSKSSKADQLMSGLRSHVYLCEDLKVSDSELKKVYKKAVQELKKVKARDSNVATSFEVVKNVYSILNEAVNLGQASRQPENMVEFNLEEIVTGEEREARLAETEMSNFNGSGTRYRYDEWDNESGMYKPDFVQVFTTSYLFDEQTVNAESVLEREYDVIQQLRQKFEEIPPQARKRFKKQISGELDYAAAVQARADMAAGITPDEKVYYREYKNNRSVTSILLAEISGSTNNFINLRRTQDGRIIDLIKRTSFYFCEALDAAEDPFAVAAFSGETEQKVQYYTLKNFQEEYGLSVQQAISSLTPQQQNRDGAGIRHAAHELARQPEKTKLLFYLMEGLPHDFNYEKEYAIEDTRYALREAVSLGCVPIVLAYGSRIPQGVRSLAESCTYREVRDPRQVPEILPHLYGTFT